MKQIFKLAAVALLAVIITSSAAFAVDTAGTVPKGQYVFEIEYEPTLYKDGRTDNYYYSYLYYGINDRFHIELIKPWKTVIKNGAAITDRWADTGITFKYRFIDDTPAHPAFGAKINFDLNDGGDTLVRRSGFDDYGITLITSKWVRENIEARLNAGYQINVPDYNNQITYGAALLNMTTKNFGFKIEYTGNWYKKTPGYSEIGVYAIIAPEASSFYASIGYIKGLSAHAPNYGLDFDFSFLLN